MKESPDDGHIDKLEESLYSRAHPHAYTDTRSNVTDPHITLPHEWQHEAPFQDVLQRSIMERDHTQGKLFKKILWISIGFFVIALGISAYFYFGGNNVVSSANINIAVAGPTSIPGGSTLSLSVDVQNKNSADLQDAALMIEYPEGSRVAGDLSTALSQQSIALGAVKAGTDVSKTLSAVLYGQKSAIETIKITLQYKIAGSGAVFTKEKDYDIALASSPLIVTANYPTAVNSNQAFDIVLTVTSNSSDTLHNVLVSAGYPFGYTFQKATPSAISGNSVFSIGDLAPGDSQTITIHGVLQGENADERSFLFNTGIASPQNHTTIGTDLTDLSESITLQKPAIALDATLNGSEGEPYVTHAGESVPVTLRYQNNTPNKLLNNVITVTLTGMALDPASVIVSNGGFYDSSKNTITWDKTGDSLLSEVDPGGNGSVGFRFSSLSSAISAHADVTLAFDFTGNQLLANNTPQSISSDISRTASLGSELGFSSLIVRSKGPFTNTGPLPPKAGEPTTYTVTWTLTNSLNDVENAKVTATLPSYVSWNNLSSPGSESVSFDPTTNSVMWLPGTVDGGTGFDKPARTVSFQITFNPSLSQVGTAPTLVNGPDITATDSFTQAALEITRNALTTALTNDPTFKQGDDLVVK